MSLYPNTTKIKHRIQGKERLKKTVSFYVVEFPVHSSHLASQLFRSRPLMCFRHTFGLCIVSSLVSGQNISDPAFVYGNRVSFHIWDMDRIWLYPLLWRDVIVQPPQVTKTSTVCWTAYLGWQERKHNDPSWGDRGTNDSVVNCVTLTMVLIF